jgi:GTP-binding protein
MPKINFSNASFKGAFIESDKIPFDKKTSNFVFIGRSNVGKSSLINALTRKPIAKTSATPGKTETINLYSVDQKISLFDLPGYGYAKFKDKRKAWGNFIDEFLQHNSQDFSALVLLLDLRHDLSEEDFGMLQFLNTFDCPLAVIFTKSDKLNAFEQKKNVETLCQQVKTVYDKNFDILTFSNKIPQLCKQLEKKMELWAD